MARQWHVQPEQREDRRLGEKSHTEADRHICDRLHQRHGAGLRQQGLLEGLPRAELILDTICLACRRRPNWHSPHWRHRAASGPVPAIAQYNPYVAEAPKAVVVSAALGSGRIRGKHCWPDRLQASPGRREEAADSNAASKAGGGVP